MVGLVEVGMLGQTKKTKCCRQELNGREADLAILGRVGDLVHQVCQSTDQHPSRVHIRGTSEDTSSLALGYP